MNRDENTDQPKPRKSDVTYAFATHLVGELEAMAAVKVEHQASAALGTTGAHARLLVVRGPNAGAEFILDRALTVAGRNSDCDICLDDSTVSRRHVEFRREDGHILLVDIDSLNNTYVNQEPVYSAVLANGDEIQIGKYRLAFIAPTGG